MFRIRITTIVLGRCLKQQAQWLCQHAGRSAKTFVDTAPVMEKPLAGPVGVGWQGKHADWHTNEGDRCGSCRPCLDACPIQAFPAPYQPGARRCISYLTIEHKAPIKRELRPLMGKSYLRL